MKISSKMTRGLAFGFVAMMLITAFSVLAFPASAMPEENTTDLAPLSVVRHAAATAYYEGKIYVFGGETAPAWGTVLTSVLIYDIATGLTTRGTDMPTGVAAAAYARAANGTMYVIGGVNLSAGTYPLVTQIYDPDTDSWSSGAAPPSEIGRSASTIGIDGRIYIFGNGWNPSQTLIYNPVSVSYTHLTLPTKRIV